MKNKKIKIAAIACTIAVVCMIVALCIPQEVETKEFVPPAFDSAAQKGTPEGMDESWQKLYQKGMGFSLHICGKISAEDLADSAADLYFTNDEENTVWLKLRVMNESGAVVGETGLIKPGEYIKTVALSKTPKKGENLRIKIMAYEPNTYRSAGSVMINTVTGA